MTQHDKTQHAKPQHPTSRPAAGPSVSEFLGAAFDLSTLGTAPDTQTSGDAGNEFSVAIVGDRRGRPQVMLAFGHIQWVFEPGLARDLGEVLVDAANRAEDMPPAAGPELSPSNTAPSVDGRGGPEATP